MPEKDGWTIRVTQEDGKARIIARGETFSFIFECPGTIIFNGPPTEEPKVEQPQVETPLVAPTPEPTPEPKPENKEEKKDRVTLTGRVGIDPKVEETKNGKKILKVPVAVKEDDKTTWHNVMFFGDKAEAMVDKVSKGKLVTVIGYKHLQERTVKGPNGPMTKTSEVIFGSAISDPNKKRTDTHDFKHSYPKE